jgi:hypothetical protein
MSILYHYTSFEGIEVVRRSGLIQSSTNTFKDAISGPGVYLTSLPPSTNTQQLAQSNWAANAGNAIQQNKLDYYISFRSVDVRISTGNSWLVPHSIDLRKVPHRVYKRLHSSDGTVYGLVFEVC